MPAYCKFNFTSLWQKSVINPNSVINILPSIHAQYFIDKL